MSNGKTLAKKAAELRAKEKAKAAGVESPRFNPNKKVAAVEVYSPALPERTFGMVDVDRITDAVDNIRSYRGMAITPDIDPKLPELAESIRRQGVIEPIVVQNLGNGAYCLVAGFRRFAASKMAGRGTIPACIYNGDLSEQQIVEIQITENIHRSDLAPTEEANIYKRMADGMGCTREEIAARVGKSVKHVSRYLKLLTLPDEIRAKIDSGEVSLAKANVMLSLTGINLKRFVEHDDYMLKSNWTAKEFEQRIKQRYMYEIGDTIGFDTGREYTVGEWAPGGSCDTVDVVYPPCTACPHRDQLEMFEEYATDKSCPNARCFEAKQRAAESEKEEEERARRAEWEKKRAARRESGEEVEETPEERKQRERKEKWEEERLKRKEAEDEACRRKAEEDLEKREPLIAKKFAIGFSWPKDYFAMEDDEVLESYNEVRDAVLDGLYKKYVGRGMAEIKERGSFEEIAMALFVKAAYEDDLYRANLIELGIEPPDEEDEGEPDGEEYGVDGDGEALDSERGEDE